VSWLSFTNRPDDDINGAVSWIKPATPKARYYSAGFSEQLEALGSKYHRPPGTNAILDLPSGQVIFSGGNLDSDFTNAVSIGRSSRVTNLGGDRMNLSFATATGRFKGSIATAEHGKPMPFSGVVFQKMNSGSGFLLGTNESSRVMITP
jgi:hypothetical protein